VRRWLLDLPPRPDAVLEERREWHYEQRVYREQVHGMSPDPDRHRQLAREARSYAEALGSSCFALCPAGAGPNSIRLWEALGFGAIPVILSDSLRLPGDGALWRQAGSGARLLIRLEDGSPPELQERLWRGTVTLAATLLAGRPDVRWQLSCRALRLESLSPPPVTGSGAAG
jgi:hypothetical protein